jgi:hypothetical protein
MMHEFFGSRMIRRWMIQRADDPALDDSARG